MRPPASQTAVHPAGTTDPGRPPPDTGAVADAGRLVQAHGFLLAIDPLTSVVAVASANLESFIGVTAENALGATLTELFGAGVAGRLPMPRSGEPDDKQPRPVRLEQQRLEFEAVAHRSGPSWVLEFEPSGPEPESLGSLYDTFRRTLNDLRSVTGIDEQCATAAREVRALIGYDRVMVYRFNPTGTECQVIAESLAPGIRSRLRLCYPVGEAAQAARQSYLRHWVESTSDATKDPVELRVAPHIAEAGGLDLTMAALRPIAGVTLDDLRSAGVGAALTLSLVVDGRLWGLLTCHHQTPRRVPHQVRASCEILARVLSLQIRAEEARLDQERTSQLRGLVDELVASMAGADSLAEGAAAVPEALLGMVGADGVVLQIDGSRISVGRTPAVADVDALLARVSDLAGHAVPPWTTDMLPALESRTGSRRLPATPSEGAGMWPAGVLHLPFGGRHGDFGLWLRAEHVRTISWGAGPDPAAPVVSKMSAGPDAGGSSGERDEVRRGQSRPWTTAERAAAVMFATAQPALLLHQAQRVLLEQGRAAAAARVTADAERRYLEHQLHQNQRLESLGQLAGGVAHDFNNLLSVILNYADLVADRINQAVAADVGGSWREAQQDLEHVRGATRRSADLTRQLLTFARREVVEVQPVNLNLVVRKVRHLLQRTLGERIKLVTDLGGGLRPLLADPGQLEQILVNLAVNARDAMADGGSLSISTARVDDDAAEPRVLLRVRDTGTGIPQEIVERIFEPFFTTKPVGVGTGLGLATVRGIVMAVGGTIEVESDPGHGTTFTMEFPTTDRAPVAAGGHPGVPQPGGGETVLVVEDGDDLREVTRRLLAAAGYTVLTAANGYQAIEAAAGHPTKVDLLLTDLIMPFMTGDELASRLRDRYPELRVLFMSGYAAPLLAVAGSIRPDYPLLDKPFSRAGLLFAVLDVFEQPPTPLPGPPAGSPTPYDEIIPVSTTAVQPS